MKRVYRLLDGFRFPLFVFFLVSFSLGVVATLRSYAVKTLIDAFESHQNVRYYILFYLFALFFQESIWLTRNYLDDFIRPYLKANINNNLFNKLVHYDDFFYQNQNSSSILNAMRNVVQGVDEVMDIVKGFLGTIGLLISSAIAFYSINYDFFKILLIWFAFSIVVQTIFSVICYKKSVLAFKYKEQYSFFIGDVFNNIATAQIFDGIEHEKKNVNDYGNKVADAEFSREIFFSFVALFQTVSFFIVMIFFAFKSYDLFSKGLLTAGTLPMFLDLSQTIYYYLNEWAEKLGDLIEAKSSIDDGLNLIEQDGFVYKKSSYLLKNDGLSFEKPEIVLDNIAYKYPNTESGYDFCMKEKIVIPYGSTVAIVGPSGGGKTTLFKLMLRVLNLNKGKILINNQDISDINIQLLRSLISFVPQNYGLFKRSIEENIKYGSFDLNHKDVENAAKDAKIHSFIETCEGSYGTIVDQDQSFSGGQKQRIMIARGLCRNAKIFLFDESTSALDVKTESDVLENINDIEGTKFIIAHRLRTIEKADLILFVDNGEIVEKGTHEQLMNKQGKYYSLVKML